MSGGTNLGVKEIVGTLTPKSAALLPDAVPPHGVAGIQQGTQAVATDACNAGYEYLTPGSVSGEFMRGPRGGIEFRATTAAGAGTPTVGTIPATSFPGPGLYPVEIWMSATENDAGNHNVAGAWWHIRAAVRIHPAGTSQLVATAIGNTLAQSDTAFGTIPTIALTPGAGGIAIVATTSGGGTPTVAAQWIAHVFMHAANPLGEP